MGILETLALVAGAGVVMYYGYSIVLSKLNQQQTQLPPPIIIPAPAAPIPYSPPASTNTIKEPTKQQQQKTPTRIRN